MKKFYSLIVIVFILTLMVFSPGVFAAGVERQTVDSETSNDILGTSATQDLGVTYRTHVQNNGWENNWAANGSSAGTEGQCLRLEAIEINLTGANLPTGAKIEYRTHVQNNGWESSWTSDGNRAGTEGQSLRLEAIQIRLVAMPGYAVQYRTHVQNQGWDTTWTANGESAGTEGQSLRLEAIEIRLVKNGLAPEGLNAKAASHAISLTWKGVNGADSYTIYQSATSSDGDYTEVAAGIAAVTYVVPNLEDGKRYYYKVKATAGDVDSPLTEAATAIASVDDQGNVLLGNQLLISNESTDIENTQSTGTLSSGADVMETSELDLASYGFDAILPFEPSAGQRPIDPSNGSLLKTSEVYELNSTKDFYTYSFITGNMDQTHARLAYNGTHGQVWVDADNPTMFITDDDACLIGEAFDDSIYPLITENFYTESDVNADGKIAILCFDIQDNYAIPGDAYCNGYFSPEDLYDGADSNRMEIFCMDTYPTMGNDVNNPNVSQIFVGLAHEFQHMVNFNRNEIEEKSGYMDTWLDEALSEAAGYMYQVLAESAGQDCKDVHTMRLSSYNKSDAIRNGKSLLDWNTSADNLNYALSYFFGQYLRTQVDEALGSGNGVKVFNEIITDPGNGNAAVESVIQKYIDPQLTFGEFLTNYRAAMVLKADTGSFGFNGEEAFNGISTPLYIGGTTNLAGGGAIVTAIDAPFTVPVDQGTDVSCLGIFW